MIELNEPSAHPLGIPLSGSSAGWAWACSNPPAASEALGLGTLTPMCGSSGRLHHVKKSSIIICYTPEQEEQGSIVRSMELELRQCCFEGRTSTEEYPGGVRFSIFRFSACITKSYNILVAGAQSAAGYY